MKSSLRAAAGAALVLGGITGAQAGFFERLFGIEPEPQRYYYQPAPAGEGVDVGDDALDITVRKRPKERAVRKERKRQDSVETASVPPEALDPAKNPDWYLQDPTLRRGDIVVLKGEVLVFRGGRLPFSRANFASLSESDLPKEERERLAHMAGLKPVLPPRTTVASAAE
ncbi:hypothetical protein [Enterovirga aerilata]|uniref:Uncharacterized protein n=1 Tax=Enterovirga aerilata TaxID=2730920 RepID=A0A849IBM2_9HYPH|nr:hypothetical protein [Enterovirga sp. DB1703]NNM71323.1 hypothetical protein [Enterovirga sp. DB1703]